MTEPPGPASTLAERLAWATERIAPISDTPRLDAELLLACALGMSRAALLARLRDTTPAPDFPAWVARRAAAEPLAYLLGEWEFYALPFTVAPPLLTPRPETEHLVETVLEEIGRGRARLLEIGCGTGCVAVAVAVHAPHAQIVAVDIHPRACAVTARNARRHGVRDRVQVFQGDMACALDAREPAFDVVCSNPPYVEESAWHELSPVIRLHEDPGALLSGSDGLDAVRRIVADARSLLRPGGLLALEIGAGQAPAVRAILADAGYTAIRFVKDLADIERIAAARLP